MTDFKFKDNSFNFIRLICAVQVFYGHGLSAFQLHGNEILTALLGMFRGVPIFFALSGYLLWASLERNHEMKVYFRKRFLRLYPELWVTVIFSIITLIPFITFNDYNILIWVFGQCTLFQFWTPDALRGFGVGTPNGALWTVTIFAQFYVFLFFFRSIRNNQILIRFMPIIGVIINIAWIFFIKDNNSEIFDKMYRATIFPYIWIFSLGILISEYKNQIIPWLIKRFYPIAIALGICCISNVVDFNMENYLLVRTILSVLFVFGFSYKFININISIDISYEIYLVHMIVINLFVQFGFIASWYSYFYSAVLSVGLAGLLWYVNKQIIRMLL